MAILVTGGSGYVGLNVVEALARAGREVVSFDRVLPPPVAAAELSTLPGRRSPQRYGSPPRSARHGTPGLARRHP